MKLSDHFTLSELTRSSLAKRLGIPNVPTEKHIARLKLVCEHVLEPVRRHFGKPVRVNSGLRVVDLNEALGGSNTSDHVHGRAVDFEIQGVDNHVLAWWCAKNLQFDQVILEYYDPEDKDPNSGWVHVGYRGPEKNRMMTLYCHRVDGAVIYESLPPLPAVLPGDYSW